VEAFFYDETLWQTSHILENNSAAMLFRRGTAEVLIGNVQAAGNRFCRENAENAFESFENLLKKAGLPVHSVIRQWNYIENILGMEGEKQRYQEFNNVRSEFYASHFNQTGFPAATGIGMNRGGVIIEFVAVNSTDAVSLPLDNPVQTAAHGYSQNVLVGNETSQKSTPKFERARYLEIFGKKMVFISGTASIRGEKTLGQDNPAEQTRITIENIRQLYSPEVLSKINTGPLRPRYGHARVYVKNRKDFVTIKKTFQRFFGKLPVVYIVADICREDLLVEIEGKVIME
jgi:enamine deaminase RidA (YjgF/YER057c/UK114 family)